MHRGRDAQKVSWSVAGDDGGVALALHGLRFKLEADQEHVEQQAHLAERIEHAQAVGREELGGKIGRQPAQKRWPQQDAGGHLADDGRLVELAKEPARCARGEQDYEDL